MPSVKRKFLLEVEFEFDCTHPTYEGDEEVLKYWLTKQLTSRFVQEKHSDYCAKNIKATTNVIATKEIPIPPSVEEETRRLERENARRITQEAIRRSAEIQSQMGRVDEY